MGGTGSGRRSPQPTALKLLKGETRPSRLGRGEPQPRSTAPVQPMWMRPEAKEVWDHSAAELRGMNNLYAADDVVLMMFSCVVNNFVRAQKIVDASEILVVRRHEGDGERQRPVLMRNPALAVVRDSVAAARNLARELGLTPGGRAMIGLAQSQNPDLRRAADLLS